MILNQRNVVVLLLALAIACGMIVALHHGAR